MHRGKQPGKSTLGEGGATERKTLLAFVGPSGFRVTSGVPECRKSLKHLLFILFYFFA